MKDMYDSHGSVSDIIGMLQNNDSVIVFEEYTLTINGIRYTFVTYDGKLYEYIEVLR